MPGEEVGARYSADDSRRPQAAARQARRRAVADPGRADGARRRAGRAGLADTNGHRPDAAGAPGLRPEHRAGRALGHRHRHAHLHRPGRRRDPARAAVRREPAQPAAAAHAGRPLTGQVGARRVDRRVRLLAAGDRRGLSPGVERQRARAGRRGRDRPRDRRHRRVAVPAARDHAGVARRPGRHRGRPQGHDGDRGGLPPRRRGRAGTAAGAARRRPRRRGVARSPGRDRRNRASPAGGAGDAREPGCRADPGGRRQPRDRIGRDARLGVGCH